MFINKNRAKKIIGVKKKTTIGNGTKSRLPKNKHSTKKKYRGQGK